MNETLKKRIYSLLWRAGGMAVVFILNGIITMMTNGDIVVPQIYVILSGLVVSEITKYFNNLSLKEE